MTHLLAIDQGTTNTKAVLVADDGTVLRRSARPRWESRYPRPGWVEQDAELLWGSVLAAIQRCLEHAPAARGDLAGIALSTQRESVLTWHRRTGRPLGPVIGWQDVRTADWCRDRTTADDDALVRSRTGLRIDAMFSAPKIGWLLRRSGAASANPGDVCAGTVDSWLVWRLTGGRRHVIEAGNASRTLLYDVVDLAWSQALLTLFGVPAAVLPAGSAVRRRLRVDPELPGLTATASRSLAVLADSHAALFGQGCREVGTAKATYGTGTSVMTPTAAFVPGFSPVPSTLAWLTEAPTYAREGNILASGATLAWTAKLLPLSVSELLELAATVTSAGAVTLLPAFTGLGAPHWDRDVRAVITQLTPTPTGPPCSRRRRRGRPPGLRHRRRDRRRLPCHAGQPPRRRRRHRLPTADADPGRPARPTGRGGRRARGVRPRRRRPRLAKARHTPSRPAPPAGSSFPPWILRPGPPVAPTGARRCNGFDPVPQDDG